jgi:hypothetical protein
MLHYGGCPSRSYLLFLHELAGIAGSSEPEVYKGSLFRAQISLRAYYLLFSS